MSFFEEIKKKAEYASSPEGVKEASEFLGLPEYEKMLERTRSGQPAINPLEVMGMVGRPVESVTAAPARAAISSLQGNLDLGEAMRAFANQFGRNVDLAPTGKQIAERTGLSGKAAAAAGLGLDIAIDPSSIMGGAALKAATAMKALPLIGLAGTVAKTGKAAERTSEAMKIAETGSVLAKQDPLGFYSKLEDVILSKMGKSATPEQVMSIAKGAKEEEVAVSGLADFLKGKEKVTQEEVLQQIRENRPQITEVQKTESIMTPAQESRLIELRLKEMGRGITGLSDEELTELNFLNDLEVGRGEAARATVPKFSQYQEPGGKNYREVLFTLPPKGVIKLTKENVKRVSDEFTDSGKFWVFRAPDPIYGTQLYQIPKTQYSTAEEALDYIIKTKQQPDGDPTKLFKSTHWNEPNVLAHARVNERVDETGKKLLHVEEIQSDWHQKGREVGYQSKELEALKKQKDSMTLNLNERRTDWQLATTKLNAILEKIVGRGDDLDKASNVLWRQGPTAPLIEQKNGIKTLGKDLYDRLFSNDELMSALKAAKEASSNFDRALIQHDDLIKKIDAAGSSGVPDAPFKKNWMELMAKRLINQAVESGADRMSWTPGAKQAARYDLSKHIEQVNLVKSGISESFFLEAYDKRGERVLTRVLNNENEVANYIGKEASDRLLKQPQIDRGGGDTLRQLSGTDLSIGGEGMKGFYDKMLPDFLRKFGKKYGAEVGETTADGMKVPFLELTPALKKAVKEEGLPLFKVGVSAGMPALMEKMRRDRENRD